VIALWMLYVTAVSLCLGLAALAVERTASLWARPRRFVWTAAILASLLVPLVGLLLPSAPARQPVTSRTTVTPGAGVAAEPAPSAPSATAAVSLGRAGPIIATLNRPLLLLWCGASLVLALGLLRAGINLRLRARDWRATVADGTPVLVAPDIGPAVVRLGGLRIVLPEWALEGEPAARPLMLLHEQEHCRARDPDLLLGATLALVLAPWNVALWWQVRRLQLAVETDCDGRVMRAGADVHAYGALLLSVGARRARQPLLAATAFSETRSLLERRIHAMTTPRSRHPLMRATLASSVALLVVAVAAMMPQPKPIPPMQGRVLSRVRVGAESGVAGFRVFAAGGGYARGDSTPRVRSDTLGLFAPAVLTVDLSAGEVHFVADPGERLRVDAVPLEGGAALWLEATGTHVVLDRGGRRIRAVSAASAGDQPGQQPRYSEDEVEERPERLSGPLPQYPDSLRAAGVSGRVVLEVVVDSSGHVEPGSVQVVSSTNTEFAASASHCVLATTFRPGRINGRPVRTVTTIPFDFSVATTARPGP
jgi:TonB family protein